MWIQNTILISMMIMIIIQSQPMMMITTMVMILLFSSTNLFIISKSSWLPSIMILITVGGLLVIYILISSQIQNEKEKIKWTNKITLTSLLIPILMKNKNEEKKMEVLSNLPFMSKFTLIFSCLLMTFIMIMMSNMSKSPNKSMKSCK